MIIDMLVSTGKVMGALVVLGAMLAAYPRTRRVAYAVVRFSKAHMSPWMLAVVGICALVPGELDEVLVLPVLFALVLRTRRNRVILRRYVRAAWAAR